MQKSNSSGDRIEKIGKKIEDVGLEGRKLNHQYVHVREAGGRENAGKTPPPPRPSADVLGGGRPEPREGELESEPWSPSVKQGWTLSGPEEGLLFSAGSD